MFANASKVTGGSAFEDVMEPYVEQEQLRLFAQAAAAELGPDGPMGMALNETGQPLYEPQTFRELITLLLAQRESPFMDKKIARAQVKEALGGNGQRVLVAVHCSTDDKLTDGLPKSLAELQFRAQTSQFMEFP